MKLLYISKYQFVIKKDGIYSLPAYGNEFWKKYLDIFDSIEVLGESVKGYLDNGTLSKITDKRIKIEILPENTNPKNFKNDKAIKAVLSKKISCAEAILIKPANRKGMQAISIAKKYNKPYMIEITGDLNLTLKNHKNILKRMYGPIIHKQILNAIKDCNFGLYVTDYYLQKIYPIKGKQCGCTDTVIPNPDKMILKERIEKIINKGENDVFNIGMVASYHDNRKGIDTAIKAISLLKNNNVELHILGLGTQDDKEKWFSYAERRKIKKYLFFDKSLSNVNDVLSWNDQMDLIILPSRSEGLPRCIVESLSRACPCIISNVCGLPELVNQKWLHSPGDYRKLSSLIKLMIENKELQKEAAIENFNKSLEFKQSVLIEKRNSFLNDFKEYCQEKIK